MNLNKNYQSEHNWKCNNHYEYKFQYEYSWKRYENRKITVISDNNTRRVYDNDYKLKHRHVAIPSSLPISIMNVYCEESAYNWMNRAKYWGLNHLLIHLNQNYRYLSICNYEKMNIWICTTIQICKYTCITIRLSAIMENKAIFDLLMCRSIPMWIINYINL